MDDNDLISRKELLASALLQQGHLFGEVTRAEVISLIQRQPPAKIEEKKKEDKDAV